MHRLLPVLFLSFFGVGCGVAPQATGRLAQADSVTCSEEGGDCYLSYNCWEKGGYVNQMIPGTCSEGTCKPTNYCNAPPETDTCQYFNQYSECGPVEADGFCASGTTKLILDGGKTICCSNSSPVHKTATETTAVTVE